MNRIIKYLTILSCTFLTASCDSIFKPLDENITDSGYLEKNPSNAEGLLMQSYFLYEQMHFWSSNESQYFLSAATDDAVMNKFGHGYGRSVRGELSDITNPIGRFEWINAYRGVTYVNKFLSIAGKVRWAETGKDLNELFLRRLTGEALALRAAMHFEVFKCFAGKDDSGQLFGVPYYDRFIEASADFKDYQRLPFDQMVEKLNSDFEEAYRLLPYVYSDNFADIPEKDKEYDKNEYVQVNGSKHRHRIDGRIVRAMQARLMIFAGSEAYQVSTEMSREYNEMAAVYAAEVLASNQFKLAPDGLEFYNDDNDLNNPEFLWRITKQDLSASPEQVNFMPSMNGKGFINPSQNLVDAFPMNNGYPITDPASGYDPSAPYQNRDPRLDMFVIYNGAEFNGNTVNITSSNDKDGINMVYEQSTRTGYYLKKLLRPDVSLPFSSAPVAKMHMYPMVRYTEIFLILAEAQNKVGGPDFKVDGSVLSAKDILRIIRKRAMGLTSDPYLDAASDTESLGELIRNERRLELSFEGQRFWDMRRWNLPLDETIQGCEFRDGIYETFDVEERPLSDEKYRYMPLLRNDILKFNYTQNAGW